MMMAMQPKKQNDDNENIPSSLSSVKDSSASEFRHVLPADRLGQPCSSYQEFNDLFQKVAGPHTSNQTKEYCLIVVTEDDRRRILLGLKNRGFGQDFYNSFGGKVEPHETPLQSAQRELREETNINAPIHAFHQVGTLTFTFEAESPQDALPQMVVHVFRVRVKCQPSLAGSNSENVQPADSSAETSTTTKSKSTVVTIDPTRTKLECHDNEITPEWFEDWRDIPLNRMFADDSLWLTKLLSSSSSSPSMKLDGWFHFKAGGSDVNSIMFHYMQVFDPNDDRASK